MRAFWLVENYVDLAIITYPAQGDYNTEAIIYKMASARFLDVFEEETNKMKENGMALTITWAIVLNPCDAKPDFFRHLEEQPLYHLWRHQFARY